MKDLESSAVVVLMCLQELPELLREKWAFELIRRCREVLKNSTWARPIPKGRYLLEVSGGVIDFGNLEAVWDGEFRPKFQPWVFEEEKSGS